MRLIDADRLCEDLLNRWNIADTKKEELIRQVMADVVTPIVVSQPTIEPQKWISCDERLPEENLPVLVAVKQKDRLPKWVKEQTYSYVTDIDVYDDGDFDTHKNKVVAWMPLPEPWKEAKE